MTDVKSLRIIRIATPKHGKTLTETYSVLSSLEKKDIVTAYAKHKRLKCHQRAKIGVVELAPRHASHKASQLVTANNLTIEEAKENIIRLENHLSIAKTAQASLVSFKTADYNVAAVLDTEIARLQNELKTANNCIQTKLAVNIDLTQEMKTIKPNTLYWIRLHFIKEKEQSRGYRLFYLALDFEPSTYCEPVEYLIIADTPEQAKREALQQYPSHHADGSKLILERVDGPVSVIPLHIPAAYITTFKAKQALILDN
jgi:hypothetical protein